MEIVYVIVENGATYAAAYTTFSAAREAVKERHKETLAYERELCSEEDITTGTEVDVPENVSGTTLLFIECVKLNITISRLPVKSH